MRPVAIALVLVATPAAADTFGGFSRSDKPYLVNQDKLCQPLVVASGAASGAPQCQTKVGTDVIAHLDIHSPGGQAANFEASASGRTLTVAHKGGDPVVKWDAPDPIKVSAVYATDADDRVAVVYTTRRAGRDMTDVVAFDLIKEPKAVKSPETPQPGTTQAPDDPAIGKAVADAKKAPAAKALAAWKAVLALDAEQSEALYRVAVLQIGAKQKADAMATLDALAKSTRVEATEWLVEARFDKAFAPLRSETQYRNAVGLDRKPKNGYERFMGFGGQWEQAGTQCDSATVSLVALRDRTFKLKLHEACNGTVMDLPFHGTWKIDADQVVLVFPPDKTNKATVKDEAPCKFESHGDEDSLHCEIGKDLDFTVLPTRR